MSESFSKPSASISELVFSGGDTFALKEDEKVIIVGPNNSGKSQSLREIFSICENGIKPNNLVVTNLTVSKSGDFKDLRKFLADNADLIGETFRFGDWQITERLLQYWESPFLIAGLAGGFIRKIAADDRLRICDQQNSIAPEDQKSRPQHILYDDEVLMNKISELFSRAFGKELMFDFRGGSKLPIHVGETPDIENVTDRVSNLYVSAVRENPLLDKQGDGMKSYAGILFDAVVANRDITLIDEPEAFLHPPQMRRLGETLSSEVKGQLFVATHSSDIMRGFLEGTQGNVRILRLRREGSKNLVSEASPDVIKELWEKPELRYSNALEGIFHEQTVICEDDSDCRLINCVADYLSSGSESVWQDTSYVPTGGKHGVPKVAAVLRKIGVPIKAVFDIDFLSERTLVETTVKAFGGSWESIEPFWCRVDSAVRDGVKPKTVEEIKSEIAALLANSEPEKLPKGDISEAMKQGKPWAEVKKHGSSGIPRGEAQENYRALKERLEQIGIYLVPVGEIENFCPEIGSHGPKYVTKLLSSISINDNRLEELRRFVEIVHKGHHAVI